jgi:flagellar assembly protein FliH
MYSSKIYKSGSSVDAEDLVLKQLHSPEALKELLELEKFNKEKSELDGRNNLPMLEKQAYEKGFQAGEKAGLEIAEEKANIIITKVQSVYDEISGFKERYLKENTDEIVSLIKSAAEKVINEELKVNKDVVLKILENAIESMTSSEKVEIRLNSEDLDYHREKNPEFMGYLEEGRGFSIVADHELSRGSVLIESNHSEIDARIEEGIKNVDKSVKEALQSEPDTD